MKQEKLTEMSLNISGSASAYYGSNGSNKLKAWRKAMRRYRNGLLKDLNILLARKKKDIELINLLVAEVVKLNKTLLKWKE